MKEFLPEVVENRKENFMRVLFRSSNEDLVLSQMLQPIKIKDSKILFISNFSFKKIFEKIIFISYIIIFFYIKKIFFFIKKTFANY